MEHDVKSLQVLIEQEFKSLNAVNHQMHSENKAAVLDMRGDVMEIKAQTIASNSRIGKLEVVVAVLKFAVYTIGGTLLLAGLQILIGRFTA